MEQCIVNVFCKNQKKYKVHKYNMSYMVSDLGETVRKLFRSNRPENKSLDVVTIPTFEPGNLVVSYDPTYKRFNLGIVLSKEQIAERGLTPSEEKIQQSLDSGALIGLGLLAYINNVGSSGIYDSILDASLNYKQITPEDAIALIDEKRGQEIDEINRLSDLRKNALRTHFQIEYSDPDTNQ